MHHKTDEIHNPPDISFPTDLSQENIKWSLYPMGEKTEDLRAQNMDPFKELINENPEDDTPITEVLSEYEILAKDGEAIEVLYQNQPCLYNRVVLPVNKEVSFAIVKSCVLVHWSEADGK